jgi:hypothetical protein
MSAGSVAESVAFRIGSVNKLTIFTEDKQGKREAELPEDR